MVLVLVLVLVSGFGLGLEPPAGATDTWRAMLACRVPSMGEACGGSPASIVRGARAAAGL